MDTYVYILAVERANTAVRGRGKSAVSLSQPRIEVGAANQHEGAGARGHTLVFRPLPFTNETSEIDPL